MRSPPPHRAEPDSGIAAMNLPLDAHALPRSDGITADRTAPPPEEVIGAHEATVATPIATKTTSTRFAARWLPLDLQPLETGILGYRSGQERYAVDQQVVRACFLVEGVIAGRDALHGDPSGIWRIERNDVTLWHDDARHLDVADADGTVPSGVYVDLHAESPPGGGFQRPGRHGTVHRPTDHALGRQGPAKEAMRPAGESFTAFRGRYPRPGATLARRRPYETADA